VINAMRRLNVEPTPVRIKLTRTSWRARARGPNLSYFSYITGTNNRKVERKMPDTDTNRAKPVRPEGPTPHFAWKLATLAKQAMERKLKKAWEV